MTTTVTVRPKGIACTCGARTRVTHIRQPAPGVIVRYRRCVVCHAKMVTKETARK